MKEIRAAFLNVSELLATRVLDAAFSVVLIAYLDPAQFAELAYAQAWIAPILLFFVSPEAVLYRHFGTWKANEPLNLVARMVSYRRFGYLKALLALLLAGGFSWISDPMLFERTFWSTLWAFGLVLAPQIAGADREFLRLELRFKALHFMTWIQKGLLLVGSWVVIYFYQSSWIGLALVSWMGTLWMILAARFLATRVHSQMNWSSPERSGTSIILFKSHIRESLSEFSVWQHINGCLHGWIQTLDLFFLGYWAGPIRDVGLYGSVLKIGNLVQSIPLAIGNHFAVKMGRGEEFSPGTGQIRKATLWVTAITSASSAVLALLAPWLLGLLSRGRWELFEQQQMVAWLIWILIGNVLFSAGIVAQAWIILRRNIRDVTNRIYIPWAIAALSVYGFCSWVGGPDLVAFANLAVAAAWLLLIQSLFKRETAKKI